VLTSTVGTTVGAIVPALRFATDHVHDSHCRCLLFLGTGYGRVALQVAARKGDDHKEQNMHQ
jgi:hypothetical protein